MKHKKAYYDSCDSTHQLLLVGEVPQHLRVPYIETGYRSSAVCCPPSNETVNVWTHLLGMFWAIYLLYEDAATYNSAASVDTAASVEDGAEHFWMFILTHLTAIYCFGSSAAMHHFGTHAQASPRQLDLYLKMDYIGISLGMLGPFIPGLMLGFWCHPLLQKWYLVAISVVVGGSICMQLHPNFGSNAWEHVRVATFGTILGSSAIPILHMIYLSFADPVQQAFLSVFIPSTCASLFCMGCGAVIFVMRVPESSFRKTFDVLGSSHQLWHACVFWSIANCYYNGRSALTSRLAETQCAV